ncbi:hypothetical protein RUM44_002235 [Polyplax serrata]|uniref:Epsilon-sarcoglycan n=1 Tax=Polyplax serrata TaxID=468196 RepID=A0ABR1AMC1_POLSC
MMKVTINRSFSATVFIVAIFAWAEINGENVPATKVFVLPVEPAMFNWTRKMGDDFSYRASLLNAPDLPKWIEYLYSKRHKTGFLFGVPPQDQKELEIEIIGLNSRTYETRRRVIHLNVQKKPDPATHQVHLKIDNLNVDDFFDMHRMGRLLKIFKHKLWKESFFDLYFTFLTSAVSMGARRPLKPTEGEGVVVRLGSSNDFSNTLVELQEEVKPLWKLQNCPRDYKRTSVERIFRDEGFILDWCNFKLIYESAGSMKSMGDVFESTPEIDMMNEPFWSRPTKAEVARRSYTSEFTLTILVPTLIMIVLILLLSAILGIQREGMRDDSDVFFDSVFCICEDYCRSKKSITSNVEASQFLGSTSRPSNTMSAFAELYGTTRSRTSNCQVASRAVTNWSSRPTPPPYNGAMWTTVVDF